MHRVIIALIFLLPAVVFGKDQPNNSALYQKALGGDSAAELAYAKALYPSSKEEAFKWAQKAANQGLAEAWFWMGDNSTLDESITYYTKAAQLGYPQAFPALIDHFMMGGKEANFAKAKEFADLARKKNILIGFDASDSQEKNDTINHCYEAGKPQFSEADYPPKNEWSRYKNMDCDRYRLGLDKPKDIGQYRHCLLVQKQLDTISLAEIYANGWGVPRNAKLALGLICYSDNLAPAELEGMVKTLYNTRNQTKLLKPFQFCEHITSGYNMGVCSARDEKQALAERQKNIDELSAHWSESHRIAFKKLQTAADDFFEAHSTEEQDMSGTARTSIAIGEKTLLQKSFLKSLEAFEHGKYPKNTNFQAADKALNEVYQKIINSKFSDQTGTLSEQGFITTQKKWLAYRDAWVNFGVLHYPGTKPDAWKTWITEIRTKQLHKILKTLLN